MALRINTNVTALTAHKNLTVNDERLSGSIERLSSGLRINRAADDAAGLTISEKLRTQVRGINRAIMNVQDGISMIQTAEGALNETHSMLQRMRELAIQASNDTLTTTDRLEIQKEIAQLKEDINRISYGTEFNTKKLLDGSSTAIVSNTDPTNLDAVVTGQVLTFSDFSVVILPKTDSATQTVMSGTAQVQRSVYFVRSDGEIASGSTTLQSITNFYDRNGNFILDLPQTLYLVGDNHQGNLILSRDITLDTLAARMQAAMTKDSLGVGLDFEGSTAEYSDLGETNGQLIVTSGKMGAVGRVNWTGDDALVKALGMQETVVPVEPVYNVTVTNIGVPAGSRTPVTTQISGHRAAGLVAGMDLVFTPPLSAFVNSEVSDFGISIPTPGFTFNVDDSLSATGTALITVTSGRWSMAQIVSLINTDLAAAVGINVQAQLNASNQVTFVTTNSGSSAYVSVSNVVGTNVLGVSNGRYPGSGGYPGDVTGTLPISTWDYTAAPVTINIFDNKNPLASATAVLVNNNYGGTMVSLVDDINAQLATNVNLAVRAVNNNGYLEFRALDTGTNSNFTISGADTLWITEQTTVNGREGNPTNQPFAYNQTYTMQGWVIYDDAAGVIDDINFRISDLDGQGANITITAGSTLTGTSFKTINSIVNLINSAANTANLDIAAQINPDNSFKIYAKTPGKTGLVGIADQTVSGSINTMLQTFSITPQTYNNGVGNYAYNLHIKDSSVQFQVGPNEGQFAKANIIRTDASALGINDLNVTTLLDAQKAITLLDKAIQMISSERAKLGAVENRMTYTSSSLRVALENMSASESRIRDVDMAREVVELTRFQILQQSSNAMLGQANTTPQRVLDLLR